MNKILQYFPDEFVDKKSGKIKIPQHVKRVRLDVGVSENAPMSREWIAEDRAGELLIFGFEPHPESRRILREGTSVWPNPIQPQEVGKRLILMPFALQSKKEFGTAKFYLTKNNSGCSSLFRPRSIPIQQEITVETCSLSQFFDHFPFESVPFIEYLKIDAQGADFEIVQGAEPYLGKVSVVTLEAEEMEYPSASNNLEAVKKYMLEKNFILANNLNCGDPTFVNLLYKDLVDSKKIKPFQRG